MPQETRIIWSDDGKEITFARADLERRVERFVDRVRASLPIYVEKLPEGKDGLEAIANAAWLSREEYSGALRDQAFLLLGRKHFIQDLSSGTTGEPVIRYNTWSDELGEQMLTRRVFELLGVGPEDRTIVLEIGAPEIATFYFRAYSELGVRDRGFLQVSTDFFGSIEPLERLDPTVILTVPSILARCGPRFFEIYDGQRDRSLRAVITYAEPLGDGLRQRLLDVGVEAFSFYGTTELGGTAGECDQHDGLHVQDDWILPTLRDPEEVAPGRYRGEVGWTAMHYEAQPLIKYAVGDVIEIDTNACPCGRPGVRMHFDRRVRDLICVYGLKFSFAPVEAALAKALDETEPLVQLVLTDAPKGMVMTVRVCRDHEIQEQKIIEALCWVFEFDEMMEMGYLSVEIEPVDRAYFDTRKLRRVLDERSDDPFSVDAPETSDEPA